MSEVTNHPNQGEEAYNKKDGRLWLGIFLIIGGSLWLLENLNILPFIIPSYLISWKTFLIGLGLYTFFGRKQKGSGILLIATGSLFLLHDFHLINFSDLWHILLPAVVIVLGIALVGRRRTSVIREDADRADYIDDLAIFGGGEQMVTSQNFKGGKLTAVFGGSEVDLSQADLAKGVHILDIFCLFGGSSITIPAGWTVHLEITSILGGISDNRKFAEKGDPDKVLIVKGLAIFGGGEIKYSR